MRWTLVRTKRSGTRRYSANAPLRYCRSEQRFSRFARQYAHSRHGAEFATATASPALKTVHARAHRGNRSRHLMAEQRRRFQHPAVAARAVHLDVRAAGRGRLDAQEELSLAGRLHRDVANLDSFGSEEHGRAHEFWDFGGSAHQSAPGPCKGVKSTLSACLVFASSTPRSNPSSGRRWVTSGAGSSVPSVKSRKISACSAMPPE